MKTYLRGSYLDYAAGALIVAVLLSWAWQYLGAGYYPATYIVFVLVTVGGLLVGLVISIAGLWRRRRGVRPLPLSLVVLAIIVWWIKPVHPSDAALTWRFNQHRNDFDRLGTMFTSDIRSKGDSSLEDSQGESLTDPDSASQLPEQSRRTYLITLKRLGLPLGFYSDSGVVLVPLESWGLAGDQNTKGYAYAIRRPLHTVPTLDSGWGAPYQHRFKSLGGSWYLYEYHN